MKTLQTRFINRLQTEPLEAFFTEDKKNRLKNIISKEKKESLDKGLEKTKQSLCRLLPCKEVLLFFE